MASTQYFAIVAIIGVVCVGFLIYKEKNIEHFANVDPDIMQYFSSIFNAIRNIPVPSAFGTISNSMMTSGAKLQSAFSKYAVFVQKNPNIENKSLYAPILVKAMADAVSKRVDEIVANPSVLSPGNL